MVDFDLRVKFWIKQELEIRFGSEMGQMASIPTNTSLGHILALLFQIQNWVWAGLESQYMGSRLNLR